MTYLDHKQNSPGRYAGFDVRNAVSNTKIWSVITRHTGRVTYAMRPPNAPERTPAPCLDSISKVEREEGVWTYDEDPESLREVIN